MTTAGVAWVAHMATDLPWAEAFVLGAIVSPTDPIAATAIGRRLGVPRRLIDIIEGESLVNDGTALVLLRTALAASLTGAFSMLGRGWHLVLNIVGGIAVGIAVGYVVRSSGRNSTTLRSRSRSRSSRATSRSCPPRRSACRACSRSSPAGSTSAATHPS